MILFSHYVLCNSSILVLVFTWYIKLNYNRMGTWWHKSVSKWFKVLSYYVCNTSSVFSPQRYSYVCSSMGMTYLLVWYRIAVGTPVHIRPLTKLTQNQSKIPINIYYCTKYV